MKRGCRLRAAIFISPYVPYRALSRKVCHTSSSDTDTMKTMQTHWFTPAMNRTMNTTNTASKHARHEQDDEHHEHGEQAARKDEKVLAFQPLELHRLADTPVYRIFCHTLTH